MTVSHKGAVSIAVTIMVISCIDISECSTIVWTANQFEDKILSSVNQNSNVEIPPEPRLNGGVSLVISHGKIINKTDQYMAHCKSGKDCDAGIRMICNNNKCSCRLGELFFEWPKYGCFVKAHMFDICEVSGQCMAMNPNTYCNPENGRCTCSPNYFFNGKECSLRYDSSNLKAQEVYKAAVVAAACFIVAVVGIFVACIVRRSFCRREQQLQQNESNRNSDIFSISDEIAALRAVDKPPSYEEVLQIERTFYGIPPPEYTGPRDAISTEVPNTSPDPDFSDSAINPLNPSFLSTSFTTDSGCSLNESLKNSSVIPENLGESSRNHQCFDNASTSDFVTTAEILPVPSNFENSNQNIILPSLFSQASSHNTHSIFHTSTPPPRLHRNKTKHETGYSSLPNSPYLNTMSSRLDSTVVDFHTTSRNDLLKDSAIPQPDVSHLSSDSFLSHSEISNMSEPQELDVSASIPEHNHSVTVIAYDNFGFESDLYL